MRLVRTVLSIVFIGTERLGVAVAPWSYWGGVGSKLGRDIGCSDCI